jgi:pimeloyl-ACP methyl ester carboxylesterase
MPLRILTLAALIGIGLSAGAHAQPIEGNWLGALKPAPGVILHLAVHIHVTADGRHEGDLDSLDQGALGIPLSEVSDADGALAFQVPAIHGRFKGRWDAAAKAWVGRWSQGGLDIPLSLTAGETKPPPPVAGLDGDWTGALMTPGGVKLRLALHVTSTSDATKAKLDSLDQGVMGLLVSGLSRDGEQVRFEVPLVGGAFEGVLAADGKTLAGTWRQLGHPMTLIFSHLAPGAAEPALNRPQTPHPPFPYRSEPVVFDNTKAHVSLAGTLTLPPGKGPFPAVVLIAGSGPHGRDELIFGHRPFLVLADYLTRHGIAVLRYDKRGIGESTGDYATATSLDFAQDADAAVTWLAGQPGIDPRQVGLIGHSEGGLIAPMVAARDPSVAFLVLLAGPGVDGARVLAEQGRLISKAMGAKAAEIARSSALRETAIAIVRDEADPATRAAKLKAAVTAYGAAHHLSKADLEGLEAQYAPIDSDWFRVFFTYDPAPTLRTLHIPILALIGEKDLQVPPDQNIPALRAALASDPKATVAELPGLNHLFQMAVTGGVGEYGEIAETMAPSVLARVTDWILAATKST